MPEGSKRWLTYLLDKCIVLINQDVVLTAFIFNIILQKCSSTTLACNRDGLNTYMQYLKIND